MGKRKPSLTKKQLDFVREYAIKLKSFTAAAKAAGYADARGEVDRLKANPEIMTAIAELQRAELTNWQATALKAKKVVDESMDPLLVAVNAETGQPEFVGNTPELRLKAASKVLDHFAKNDPESLLEKAAKEDTRDREALLNEILGAPTLDTPEPPENPETEPPAPQETLH